MSRYPNVSFTVSHKEKTYKGKKSKELVGSFLDEDGNRILISVNPTVYTSKKTGNKFQYARATNLGHDQERPKRGQMG